MRTVRSSSKAAGDSISDATDGRPSLGFSAVEPGRLGACLRGTAQLVNDTTKPPVTVATGLSVQVAMTDRGKGTTDSIAVTVWDGSTLVFSSDWNGAISLERVLTGGNLGAP